MGSSPPDPDVSSSRLNVLKLYQLISHLFGFAKLEIFGKILTLSWKFSTVKVKMAIAASFFKNIGFSKWHKFMRLQ